MSRKDTKGKDLEKEPIKKLGEEKINEANGKIQMIPKVNSEFDQEPRWYYEADNEDSERHK